MAERTISSFTEYVKCLEATFKAENIIFRGQPKDKTLLPKIARPDLNLKNDLPQAEIEILEEFERKCFPHIEKRPRINGTY